MMVDVFAVSAGSMIEGAQFLGFKGVLLFGLIFCVAVAFCFPASVLTALGGFIYGPLWGTVLISSLGMMSASAMFYFSRYFVRQRVQHWLHRHPRLSAIDQAVSGRGFRTVFLLRLSSIVPFAPLSYSLGVSRLSARDFIIASWLGVLPGTFLYAYLGSLASDVTQLLNDETREGTYAQCMTVGGIIAVCAALWIIGRYAKHAIVESDVQNSSMELSMPPERPD